MRRSASGEALAAVLVLVLLACHGVMGPAHLLSGPGGEPGGHVAAHGAVAHGAVAHGAGETAGAAHGSPDGHQLGGVEYAAALLGLLLLGSVLGRLLRGRCLWRGAPGAGPARSASPRPALRPPPAPSSPRLQVFRL